MGNSKEIWNHSFLLGLLLLLIGLSVRRSQGQVIKLDYESDAAALWNDNSCHYGESPEDIGYYGCSVNTSTEVLDPTGYWSTCDNDEASSPYSCDIIFDSGYLPKARKLIVRAFMVGTARITITGKRSPSDLTYNIKVGEILSMVGSEKADNWYEIPFDLSGLLFYPRIFKFNLNSQVFADVPGYILLDSVSVDLGEYASSICLDTNDNEISSHWMRDTCTYVEDSRDFLYYGCELKIPGVNKSDIGYWMPCQHSSCEISFFGGTSLTPGGLAIHGYLSGRGEIRIYSELDPKSFSDNLVATLNVGNTGDGWFKEIVDLRKYPDNTVVIVQLVGEEDNVAMVDLVSVCIDDIKGNMHDACNPSSKEGTEISCGQKFIFDPTTTTPRTSGGMVLKSSVVLTVVSLFVNHMKHQ